MWPWSCAIVFIVILVYVYTRKCFNFWRKYDVPSTSPKTILGDLSGAFFGGKSVPLVYDAIYKAFPTERFVGVYDLLVPNVLVRDPELVGNIMVKDFSHFQDRMTDRGRTSRLDYHLLSLCGEQWKTLRTKLVPTFTANKLKGMIPMIDYCAGIFDSHLREKTINRESFDAKEMASRFTLDVIGCCIFGLHFNSLKESDSEYRNIGKLIVTPSIRGTLLQLLRFTVPQLLEFFNISELPPAMVPFFTKLLEQSEEFRRKESKRRNDMMQLMLDIRDEETTDETATSSIAFNDDVILSNMFLFYVAGFETTAATISFCLYELALNPDIQTQLREEIRMKLSENDENLTYETLKQLNYMEMVLSETLRKYPPAPFIHRVCTMPYELPGTSMTLQPGMRITLIPYSYHHDEKYFPDPEKFDPKRFTPENIASRPPFTFLPFGDGPRMCIATRFAKMEMKICLTRLLSKYEFNPGPKTEIPLEMETRTLQIFPKRAISLEVKSLDKNL